jgi:hypothetical protein
MLPNIQLVGLVDEAQTGCNDVVGPLGDILQPARGFRLLDNERHLASSDDFPILLFFCVARFHFRQGS